TRSVRVFRQSSSIRSMKRRRKSTMGGRKLRG
ncbi:uncharacterized protein METZ01_LOCUS484197, partial [marine metagenome]